jgi:hypothetical protein
MILETTPTTILSRENSPSLPPSPYQLSQILAESGNQPTSTNPTTPPNGGIPKRQRTTRNTLDDPNDWLSPFPILPTPLDRANADPAGITPWEDPPLPGSQTNLAERNPTPTPNTLVEPDSHKNTEMLACLLAASERDMIGSVSPSDTQQNPYLDTEMPPIHDEHPLGLLEGIAPSQIRDWMGVQTGKVLARLLDRANHPAKDNEKSAKHLMVAAKNITGSQSVSVAEPQRDWNSRTTSKYPMTFLIHDLTADEASQLQSRKVWANKDWAFQISPIPPERPRFLFTIEGLTTESTAHVKESVLQVWRDPTSSTFLTQIVSQTPEDERGNTTDQIISYINSMEIRRLDYKQKGNSIDPHFNVYADGSLITSADIWIDIRNFFRGRSYASSVLGNGQARADKFTCTICHGRDHPNGMCPFLSVPGWKIGAKRPQKGLPRRGRNPEEMRSRR